MLYSSIRENRSSPSCIPRSILLLVHSVMWLCGKVGRMPSASSPVQHGNSSNMTPRSRASHALQDVKGREGSPSGCTRLSPRLTASVKGQNVFFHFFMFLQWAVLSPTLICQCRGCRVGVAPGVGAPSDYIRLSGSSTAIGVGDVGGVGVILDKNIVHIAQ